MLATVAISSASVLVRFFSIVPVPLALMPNIRNLTVIDGLWDQSDQAVGRNPPL
jgi:hypothetical protein